MTPFISKSKNLICWLITLNLLSLSKAGSSGYTYNKHSGVSLPSGAANNQHLSFISTVRPLPPLPALPALPTPRSQSKVLTQSLLQTHPTSSSYSSAKYSGSAAYGSTSYGSTSARGSSYKTPTSYSGSSFYSGLKPYGGSSSFGGSTSYDGSTLYGGSSSYNSPSAYGDSPLSYGDKTSTYGRSSYSLIRSTIKPKTSNVASPYSTFGRYSTTTTITPTKGYDKYGSKCKNFSSFSTIPTASSAYGQTSGTYASYGSNRVGLYSLATLASTVPQSFGHNRSPTVTTVSVTPSTLQATYNSFSSTPQATLAMEQPRVLFGTSIPEKQLVTLNASGPDVQHLLPISQDQTLVQSLKSTTSAPVVSAPTLLQPVRPLTSEAVPEPTVSNIFYSQLHSQPELQSQSQAFPHVATLASPPPLRIPFGKTALINLPEDSNNANDDIYELNGRQLKQYAVVEIIDNDIEPNAAPRPIYNTPFFDGFRARLGASNTGPYGASRVSISNALQQQRSSTRINNPTDAIALGSGGLGFIRSSNGNVYLGSGSLGYISSQQHWQSLTEARTRSGAPRPDALHFGHGPLGGNPTTLRVR